MLVCLEIIRRVGLRVRKIFYKGRNGGMEEGIISAG